MTGNYILNRESVALKKGEIVPVSLKGAMLHNLENYTFKVEHSLQSPINLKFNFSNATPQKYEHPKVDIYNGVEFDIYPMEEEEKNSYGTLCIHSNYDTTIALTIKNTEGGFIDLKKH